MPLSVDSQLRQVLSTLTANAIDWNRWPQDAAACDAVIATLARIWELDGVDALAPPEALDPSWKPKRRRDHANAGSHTMPPAPSDVSGIPACLASIEACARAVRGREVSVSELAGWSLERIRALDGQIHAFTDYAPEQVLADAVQMDRMKVDGPLAGVPVAVKDLVDVRGLLTSYGTKAGSEYRASKDSAVVAHLRHAGALIIGKTRTSEYAWSTTTPPTVNPRSPELIPGGSSGGSAAAVAGGMVLGAIGTDTGGSIRIPAALCGVVGIKPTFGVVSRSGVLPANFSLDHVGPIANTIDDARAMLRCLVAHDPDDPASASAGRIHTVKSRLLSSQHRQPLELRLGVVAGPLFEMGDPVAERAFRAALDRMAQCGITLVDVRIDDIEFVPAIALAIDLSEGAAIHTLRMRDRIDAFGEEVRRLLHFAQLIPGVLLARGHQARSRLRRAISEAFDTHRLDAIVAPATPIPAVPPSELSRRYTLSDGRTESVEAGYSRTCWLANLTGQPAVVVPHSLTPAPLGLQLIGWPYEDAALLDCAETVQRAIGVTSLHRPAVTTRNPEATTDAVN